MLRKVSVILTHLQSEEDGSLRAHAEPLHAAWNAATVASAEYAAAIDRLRQVEGVELGGRLNWIDLYKGNYYQLSERFGARAAERYFTRTRRVNRTGGTESTGGGAGEGAEALAGAGTRAMSEIGAPPAAGSGSPGSVPEPVGPGAAPSGNGSESEQQVGIAPAESSA